MDLLMNKMLILIIITISLIAESAFANTLYILHLKSGGKIKCININETQDIIMCDADGLIMAIGKDTVNEITVTQGRLNKKSPQIGPRTGGGRSGHPQFIKGQSGQQTTPGIKSSCQNKWGTDYEMVEYCIKKQTEAWNNLRGWSGPIKNECSGKWGTDYEMVEYCIKKQTEAKNNIDSIK
ncbi:MAG: hypothetical protein WC164_04795 [Patescibacteria group bacterium]|jgi:hypothetical protein